MNRSDSDPQPLEYSRRIRWHMGLAALRSATFTAFLILCWFGIARGQDWTLPWYYHSIAMACLSALGFSLYRYLNRKMFRRMRVLKQEFPVRLKHMLTQHVIYYNFLPTEKQRKFEQRVMVFLDEKKMEWVGQPADELTALLIAAGAVIPSLGLPDWDYQNAGTIFIYPEAFDSEYRYGKGAPISGQVTNSHLFHAVAFSKAHVLESFLGPNVGRNVAVHEFVHLIDRTDGATDGEPDLYWKAEDRKRWNEIRMQEHNRIAQGRTLIDRYALSNPVEFLAVMSEYFFSMPDLLYYEHREVYDLLVKAFQQDPQQLLERAPQVQRYKEMALARDQFLAAQGSQSAQSANPDINWNITS